MLGVGGKLIYKRSKDMFVLNGAKQEEFSWNSFGNLRNKHIKNVVKVEKW